MVVDLTPSSRMGMMDLWVILFPLPATGFEMAILQLQPRKHERKSSGVSGGLMASRENVFASKKEPQKGMDPSFL